MTEPGTDLLVPEELGHERDYLGNPYVVPRELVATTDYYVSHSSAMEIEMIRQNTLYELLDSSYQTARLGAVQGSAPTLMSVPKLRAGGCFRLSSKGCR